MSLNIKIPTNIEHGIQRFAREKHLSDQEAVLRLIETGLRATAPLAGTALTVFAQGLGLFGSPEDSALLDEVVAIAYEERHGSLKR